MWNSSQYGGDSEGTFGGGGGGFMNSPGPAGRGGGFGGRGGGAGGGGGGGSGLNRINSMTPCTCAELLAAVMTEDQFTSPAGVPLGQVTFVGCVKQATRTATRVDYIVDDHTGSPIDVKQFVDNEADDEFDGADGGVGGGADSVHPDGAYIRVYGQLRNIQGQRTVSAFKVTRVTDLNEISFHMLQVVKAKLSSLGASAAASGGGQTSTTGLKSGAGGSSGAGSTLPEGLNGLTEPGAAGMNKMEQQVLAILRDADCDEGVSVDYICQRLAGVPAKRVRDLLNNLGDEGHVYSSTDDDHYRLIK